MTIDDVIERLKTFREAHGNADVKLPTMIGYQDIDFVFIQQTGTVVAIAGSGQGKRQ